MPHKRGKLGKPNWSVRPSVLLDEAVRSLCGDGPECYATSVPKLIESTMRILVSERYPGWEELGEEPNVR